MNEPMLDYVRARLMAARGRQPAIARATGIPYKTLRKIASGEVTDPGVSKIQRLHDYFCSTEAAA